MNCALNNKSIAAQTKEKHIPFYLNSDALHGLVARIAGPEYAKKIHFQQISANAAGMDRYEIFDGENGDIQIHATSGVAAANAFRWYLENRCNSYIGPLNRRLNFPADPPKVGERRSSESACLYRYFLNYCTFGYTFVFWQWDKWEELIDWMMLSGYNLILNPIGTESVWLTALQKLGYTLEEARSFVCSPVIFPWQCMNNITGWAGAASMNYYTKRLKLAMQINERIRSFGAEIAAPGWSGMVPADFEKHFPESKPHYQGSWCGMTRPAIITQEDPKFAAVAYYYYQSQKDLLGEFRYFSTDPFHEGGNCNDVDLDAYAKACLKHMGEFSHDPVWFLQGWGSNPMPEILKALPVANVLIGDLQSKSHTREDNFIHYPWLYGTVDNFGGQRRLRGNLNALIQEPMDKLLNNDLTAVGLAMFPEGLETDEMMFDIIADQAISTEKFDPDNWMRKRLAIRYGFDSQSAFEGWKLIRDHIYTGAEPRDSGLLSRPSLSVAHVISQVYALTYSNETLGDACKLLMEDFDMLCCSEAYRMDIMDAFRQLIGNAAWTPIKNIQDSFYAKDEKKFEENVDLLMRYFDLQEALTETDKHSMLGPWIEMARKEGETPAEKAYMEFQAKTLLTLWGDRNGSKELHDYAAREWSGLLQDFYRPRWESFINILRCSFVSGCLPMDYNRYDAEYFYTTLSKKYPTEPSGELKQIIMQIKAEFLV